MPIAAMNAPAPTLVSGTMPSLRSGSETRPNTTKASPITIRHTNIGCGLSRTNTNAETATATAKMRYDRGSGSTSGRGVRTPAMTAPAAMMKTGAINRAPAVLGGSGMSVEMAVRARPATAQPVAGGLGDEPQDGRRHREAEQGGGCVPGERSPRRRSEQPSEARESRSVVHHLSMRHRPTGR
jgi:hypothetical protein